MIINVFFILPSVFFKHTADIGIKDYDDASQDDVFTPLITTFSEDGSVNFSGKISKKENTLVKALFTGDFSTMPTNRTTFYGILALDNDTVGGTQYIQEITTEATSTSRDSTNPWLGLPTSTGTARRTITGTASVLIEAVIDFTKIDKTLDDYFITARLGLKA